tara:strand:- start:490 stop:756 length:267 start_codon:yes stop_codon:yes gene_type:complete
MEFYLFGLIILFFGGYLIFQYFLGIIIDKKIIVKPIIQIKRLKICYECEHIRLKNTLYQRCVICGCFLKPKTKLINQKCPIGKWNVHK